MLKSIGIVLFIPCLTLAEDWARFRGPNGTGEAPALNLPNQWSAKDQLFTIKLPGKGNGSPIISQGKLLLQAASNDGSKRMLLAYDANSGKLLWEKSLGGGTAKTHVKNSLASSTPAADGKQIYAIFWDGTRVSLTAWSYEGKLNWQVDLGTYKSQHGVGTSPMVVGDRVVVNFDQDDEAELQAYSAKDGSLIWKAPRKAYRACYSTPFILNGVDQAPKIICASTAGVTAYDPKDGKIEWNWNWTFKKGKMALRTVAGAMYHDGLIYAVSGDGGGDRHMVAIPPGKSESDSIAPVWEKSKGTPYVPCLLFKDGLLYWVTDKEGLLCCVDPKTGEEKWSERLGGGNVTASPILIGDRILTINEQGTAYLVKAGSAYELLGKYEFKAQVYATPAVADGKLYVRTTEGLICFGKK
jgi:outer membrane protein assembly factor BamB